MQPSLVPYRKVTAATLGGSFGTLLVYLIELLGKVDLPHIVEAALTVICLFVAGYMVPENTSNEARHMARQRRP